jgi:hypothetical protein
MYGDEDSKDNMPLIYSVMTVITTIICWRVLILFKVFSFLAFNRWAS